MALDTIPSTEGGKLKAVASGTLPNGKPVVVNADGTVSAVSASTISQSVGSDVFFVPSGDIANLGMDFDPSTSKFVVAYRDAANSSYGTAVVGTVSGGTISFGTPVVYNSALSTVNKVVFDAASGNFVIGFTSDPTNAVVRVGAVSGTSISFGSSNVVSSGNPFRSMVYDPVNQKTVAFTGSSRTDAFVGTVSGTSISFGSAATVEASISATFLDTVFDSGSSQIVLSYQDSSQGSGGVARTGAVSGSSITFGSKVLFTTVGSYVSGTIAYDSSNDRIVIQYADNGQESVIVGTVSGTSISFGTAVLIDQIDLASSDLVFDAYVNKIVRTQVDAGAIIVEYGTVSGSTISFTAAETIKTGSSTSSGNLVAVFASGINKVIFSNVNTADDGRSFLLQVPGEALNLTATNYIGMSSGGAVADTGNVTVDIVGTINKDQSGLTPGQKYYVQTDGTLSTTPGSPSVLAGTAISATKMVVKS